MTELCERATHHLPEGFAAFTFIMFFGIVGLTLVAAKIIEAVQSEKTNNRR